MPKNDVMQEMERRKKLQAEDKKNIKSSPGEDTSSEELESLVEDPDDLPEDVDQDEKEEPSEKSSSPVRGKGRPKKTEKGQDFVYEETVRLTVLIPKSLEKRIADFLQEPLPGVSDKTKLTIIALNQFLEKSDKVRKQMSRLMKKNILD